MIFQKTRRIGISALQTSQGRFPYLLIRSMPPIHNWGESIAFAKHTKYARFPYLPIECFTQRLGRIGRSGSKYTSLHVCSLRSQNACFSKSLDRKFFILQTPMYARYPYLPKMNCKHKHSPPSFHTLCENSTSRVKAFTPLP